MDRADWLLQDRERDYQGALHIARNDALEREKLLNAVKIAYAKEGVVVPGLDEYIAEEIGDIRRTRRDVVSEGTYMFENDLQNHALGIRGSNLQGNVLGTEKASRDASQPIPGTEAHHPASVSSTEAIVQNMSEAEVRKLWKIAKSQGYTVGSAKEGFIPLSKPAHTTGGPNWGPDYAHVGKDGTPDTGRFKTTPLPKGTKAAEAWKALKPVLDEQRTLNERAYNHPTEQRMRQVASNAYGAPISWGGPNADYDQLKVQNANAKSKGINATTISKTYDRYPAMQNSSVPGVNTMVPGRTPPRALGKPEVRPSVKPAALPHPQAKPAPKPNTPAPTSRPVGSQATLNGKPVVWNGKGWAPVMPNRLTIRSQSKSAKPAPKSAKPASKSAKPASKPAKPTSTKPRGTAGVRISDVTPPSQERFGPGGMMSTIDMPHERQFRWRRY